MGSWTIYHGGDSKEVNKHNGNPAQNYAFDLVIVDTKQSTHKSSGTKNEDYYAYGQPVLAPAGGIVNEVVSTVRDNLPMKEMNSYSIAGNYIIIKHQSREFSLLAHFKPGSLTVRAGDKIKTGQRLGLSGNSGNSSMPHIHYHLQTSDIYTRITKQLKTEANAKGIKVFFSDIVVEKDGKQTKKALYSPIRGDIVSNQ